MAILERDPLCRHCLREGRQVCSAEVDHVIPLERGGTDDEANLQGLCKACHALKTTKRDYHLDINVHGYPIDPKHPFYRMERK